MNKKYYGSSPIKTIGLSLFLVLIIAFFFKNANIYINASYETKAQSQISKINRLIDSDSFGGGKKENPFFFLHSPINRFKPFEGNKTLPKSRKTLAQLFEENDFSPNEIVAGKCYLYLYWTPEMMQKILKSPNPLPGYLVATWGESSNKIIAAGSPLLQKWAQSTLKESDFKCKASQLLPSQKAKTSRGKLIDIIGVDYLFCKDYFSGILEDEKLY